MRNNITGLLAGTMVSWSAWTDELSFKAIVVDADTQSPISNVTIIAGFRHSTLLWDNPSKYDDKVGVTAADGTARFHGKTNCGIVICTVNDSIGYYDSQPVYLYGDKGRCEGVTVSMIRLFVPEKWIVTNDVRIAMRKIGNPIPLRTKWVKRWNADGLYPAGMDTVAYDLMQGDWLPPLGKGEHADIELVHRRTERGEGRLDERDKPQRIWRDEVEIRFTGEGNGLVGYVSDPSETLRIRTAPETGFRPQHLVWADMDTKLKRHSSEDRNRSFAFRIRTRRNERGEIVGAFYGKIYRNPKLLGGGGYPLNGFEMAYYLNPTPLDRNLEWDRRNNGFRGECPPYRLP